jgi:hypothetical protein
MTAMSQACTVLVSDAPFDGGVDGGADGALVDGATFDADADAAPANDCNACLVQACEDQWSVCASSADCMAIYTCATKPSCVTDTACVTACYNASPQGQKAYDAISSCDQAAKPCGCASACGVASGVCPMQDAAPEASDDAAEGGGNGVSCAACASQSCANENAACAPGTPCDAYGQCLASCTDSACIAQCISANADGRNASDKLGSCLSTNCAGACGL